MKRFYVFAGGQNCGILKRELLDKKLGKNNYVIRGNVARVIRASHLPKEQGK